MTTAQKIAGIVLMILAALFFGYQMRSDTVVKECILIRSSDGIATSSESGWPCGVWIEPHYTEVSVLVEKKKCAKAGGDFLVLHEDQAGKFLQNRKLEVASISCTKPYQKDNITGVETIFSYDLSN